MAMMTPSKVRMALLAVCALVLPVTLACGIFSGDPSPTNTPAPAMVSANILTPTPTVERPGEGDRPDDLVIDLTPQPTFTPTADIHACADSYSIPDIHAVSDSNDSAYTATDVHATADIHACADSYSIPDIHACADSNDPASANGHGHAAGLRLPRGAPGIRVGQCRVESHLRTEDRRLRFLLGQGYPRTSHAADGRDLNLH